jgi:hypothetical protein
MDGLPICCGRDVSDICYIKLGEGGRWEGECFNDGIIRLGFSTGEAKVLSYASKRQWDKLKEYWSEKKSASQTVTSYVNQTKSFFEDDGSVLWITFSKNAMWYGFSNGEQPKAHPDGEGSFKNMSIPWRNTDVHDKSLAMDFLGGNLTRTASYQGTICGLSADSARYAIDRINGKLPNEVERAKGARDSLVECMEELLKLLTWKDFEALIELIFAQSGWKRISATGGVQKTIDFSLWQPLTGERAFVQVKSETNANELESYISNSQSKNFGKMFYVYHTGKHKVSSRKNRNITIWDGREVAVQVVRNGLIDWLIEKTS